MRVRPATDEDLLPIAHVFVRTAADLTERYRPEQIGDAPADPAGRVPFYRHLLGTGAVFVAEEGDELAGFSAAVVRDGVWFLSQLWVLPERQGAGLGRALLDAALAWGSGAETISVIASPDPRAQRLYLRAGMYPLWVQHELTGSAGDVAPVEGVRPIDDADLEWMTELDREVRGISRTEDHAIWRSMARGLVLDDADAYLYVWPDGKIGPGVAREADRIPQLLRAARSAASGTASVAVPSANWTALRSLIEAGFSPAGSNTFMASRRLGDATRYLSSGGALG